MTEVKSEERIIAKPINEVFAFLSDLNNYEKMMPPDVQDFESTSDTASLSFKGLGKFTIEKNGSTPNSEIKLLPKGKLPFKFDIVWKLSETDQGTKVFGQVNAEMNMFIKMMAEPKLRSFVDEQVRRLKEILD